MQEWLLAQSGWSVYAGVLALLLTGAFGFPPEDLSLLLAGILAERGDGKPEVLFIICYAGTIIGDLIIYSFGRRFGPALFNKPWAARRFPPDRIRKIRKELERRSLVVIFIARHLFYIRTATFLTCGAFRINFARFLLADAVSAMVSVPLVMTLGYIASENYEIGMRYLKKLEIVLALVSVAALAALVIYYIRRRRRTAARSAVAAQSAQAPDA